MQANEIVTYGNDILRREAEEIQELDDGVRDLIQHMYQVMADARGLGLAGPQVGVGKRIFVYDVGEGPHALINPQMLKPSRPCRWMTAKRRRSRQGSHPISRGLRPPQMGGGRDESHLHRHQ